MENNLDNYPSKRLNNTLTFTVYSKQFDRGNVNRSICILKLEYISFLVVLYIEKGKPKRFGQINQACLTLHQSTTTSTESIVEYLPTAFWKEENYSKYPIWVQVCCEGRKRRRWGMRGVWGMQKPKGGR